MLGATVQNFIALASCRPGFVHPCLSIYLSEQKVAEIYDTLVAVLQRVQYVSMHADRRVFVFCIAVENRCLKLVFRAEKFYVCINCFLNKVMVNNSAFKS